MKRKVGIKINLLKLALLQIAPGDSLEENLQKGLAVCREAKAKGADIALFPEMWSNGYRLHDRPVAQWQSEAIPVDGAFVSAFSDLAKELGHGDLHHASGVLRSRATQHCRADRPLRQGAVDLCQSTHL